MRERSPRLDFWVKKAKKKEFYGGRDEPLSNATEDSQDADEHPVVEWREGRWAPAAPGLLLLRTWGQRQRGESHGE